MSAAVPVQLSGVGSERSACYLLISLGHILGFRLNFLDHLLNVINSHVISKFISVMISKSVLLVCF